MKKLFAVAILMMAISAFVSADTLTFASDSAGVKANGFQSADSDYVTFSALGGGYLEVGNYTPQSNGNGLSVWNDAPYGLEMNFAGYANNLHLSFGNDDPFFASVGDAAQLRLYSGATLLATAYVTLNRDDIINQVIFIDGVAFNRATFFYTDANGSPINLIEVVDDISFNRGRVPEPGTLALLGTGLLGFGFRRRKI